MSESQTPKSTDTAAASDVRKLYAVLLQAQADLHTVQAQDANLQLIALMDPTPENVSRVKDHKQSEIKLAAKKLKDAYRALFTSPFSTRTRTVEVTTPQVDLKQLREVIRTASDPFGEFKFEVFTTDDSGDNTPFDLEEFLKDTFADLDYDEAVARLNAGAERLRRAVQDHTSTGRSSVLEAFDSGKDHVLDALDTSRSRLSAATRKLAERLAPATADK